MKFTRSLKVIICLAVLFAFGGVCGYALTVRQITKALARAKWEERWIESRFREDTTRLHLTSEQSRQVRPLYDQILVDLKAVRAQAAIGVSSAVMKQGRALWQEITPGQREELQKLNEERRARWQKTQATSAL